MWNSGAGTHNDADEWRVLPRSPAIKKDVKVYQKQSGHWKPKIISWHEIGFPNWLINLYFFHHISL
jgi:hypothetical protein